MRDDVTFQCAADDFETIAAMEGVARANGLTELRTMNVIWISWSRKAGKVIVAPASGTRLETLTPVTVYKAASKSADVWGTLPPGNSQMVVVMQALVNRECWLLVHEKYGLWVLWDEGQLREKVL